MRGNPSAVGQNQKSFAPAKDVAKGSNNTPGDRGQMPTTPVNLNLKEFNRVTGTSAPQSSAAGENFPKGKPIDRPTEGSSGRQATSEAKPATVIIKPVIRSNVNG